VATFGEKGGELWGSAGQRWCHLSVKGISQYVTGGSPEEGVGMTDDERHHAVMIIDMPNATTDEIQKVFRAVRDAATKSDAPGWPDDLAVLVGDVAAEFSERVKEAMEHREFSVTKVPSPRRAGDGVPRATEVEGAMGSAG
jgi:hypothetical protein